VTQWSKVRLKAIEATCAAWRIRRSSGVGSILTLDRYFSRGEFSPTFVADAKPGNGVLGPIFIGMVMRRVVVMVGPITRATRRP